MPPPLETLTVEEVLRIHETLVEDFARSGDPISPPGVKSMALLESAVSRQHTGHGDTLKYPDAISNAATLVYGICCDHPFHNGNKRTTLVAMLVHLDRNHLCIYASKSELYELLVQIAGHSLGWHPDPRRPDKGPPRRHADAEVREIADWLSNRVQKMVRGEKPITFRELRPVLARHGFELEVADSNSANVIKVIQKPPRPFSRTPVIQRKRIGTIGYRDEGTEVALKDLKKLRRMCNLAEEDGVDSAAFYGDYAVVDAFVNKYRTLLRRLART
jgi:death-on-curing protein